MAKQHGLEWVSTTFGLEPRWTVEPDISKVESLARKHLKIDQEARCKVSFFAQGAFNKLYSIETKDSDFLIRVTLPVDPSHKTNSEVATIRFVQKNTHIPVSRIFGFDSSPKNDLGFEWILMERLPGVALRSIWRKLPENAKSDLVKEVAKYQAELFEHKFPVIGNMYVKAQAEYSSEQMVVASKPSDIRERKAKTQEDDPPSEQPALSLMAEQATRQHYSSSIQLDAIPKTVDKNQEQSETPSPLPVLGQLVSMVFFWGDHLAQDVPRGPFSNSEAWIHARLTFALTDQEAILSSSEDEDDIEEAQEIKEIVQRLLKLLPSVFASDSQAVESCIIFHDDLSMQNILVNTDGKITGVVDWECVSAVPLWKACGIPEFLKGRDRNEKPKREIYAADSDDDDKKEIVTDGSRPAAETLDNEGVNGLYWEHLQEYELTMLRQLFWEEVKNLAPGWIDEAEKGAFKADFEEAVRNCDNSWRTRKTSSWLDALEKGEYWDLRKSFME